MTARSSTLSYWSAGNQSDRGRWTAPPGTARDLGCGLGSDSCGRASWDVIGCVDRAGAAPRPLKALRTSASTVPTPGVAFDHQRRHGSVTDRRLRLDVFDFPGVLHCHRRGSVPTGATTVLPGALPSVEQPTEHPSDGV